MRLTPPTDNLYKFLAVSGILLAISAAYFISTLDRQFIAEIPKTMELQNRLLSHLKEVEAQREKFQRTLEEEGPRNTEEYLREKDRWDQFSEELRQSADAARIPTDIEGAVLSFALYVTKYVQWKRSLSGVFWAALAISAGGFFLWYWRLQVYQDELVKLQLETMRRDSRASGRSAAKGGTE